MVHQYKMNGYNIILDVESGCVHTVDDVAYDIIELYENTSHEEIIDIITKRHGVTAEEVKEVFDDLEELRSQHTLFTPDMFSGSAHLFKQRQSVVKALCLHVAHACNMSCGYCFADEGEYHGEQAIMSYEVGKTIFHPTPKSEKSFRKMSKIMGYSFIGIGIILLILIIWV